MSQEEMGVTTLEVVSHEGDRVPILSATMVREGTLGKGCQYHSTILRCCRPKTILWPAHAESPHILLKPKVSPKPELALYLTRIRIYLNQ